MRNGTCEDACNVQACNFDDGDCIPEPKCERSMLKDGNCDELCNSE